jgi:hypothetical protein
LVHLVTGGCTLTKAERADLQASGLRGESDGAAEEVVRVLLLLLALQEALQRAWASRPGFWLLVALRSLWALA